MLNIKWKNAFHESVFSWDSCLIKWILNYIQCILNVLNMLNYLEKNKHFRYFFSNNMVHLFAEYTIALGKLCTYH